MKFLEKFALRKKKLITYHYHYQQAFLENSFLLKKIKNPLFKFD